MINDLTIELSLKTLNEFEETEREINELSEAKNVAFNNLIDLNYKRYAIKDYLSYITVKN